MKTTNSSEWLKQNESSQLKCVPLNTRLTPSQCQKTKTQSKRSLKHGISNLALYKQTYFCSICKGIETSDSQRVIGENRSKISRQEADNLHKLRKRQGTY